MPFSFAVNTANATAIGSSGPLDLSLPINCGKT